MIQNIRLLWNGIPNLSEEPFNKNEIISVCAIMALKIIIMVLMLMDGFIGLSNDDFARQLSGYSWSKDPFLFKSGWPPLQFWILGLFLKVIPNIRMVNLIVNGFFSILALVMFYYLIRLFFNKKIAILTLLIAALLPWQLKLSISGLTEPIYHFFLFSCLYFLFKWEISSKNHLLLISAFTMLFATMLRIDAWIFYIAVISYIIFRFILSPKNFKNPKTSLFILLLPLIFIFIWIMLGKFQTNFQVFQQEHINSAASLSPFHVRILRYPGYLFLISPFISIFGIVGLYPFIKQQKKLALQFLFIPLIYFIGMIGSSIITGAGTLSAPVRLALPFIYILIPISIFLFFTSNKLVIKRIGYIYLIILFAWNIIFSFTYNKNDFVDISNVSQKINKAWSNGTISKEQKILMEKNSIKPYHGDHLVFKVHAKYPDNVNIYDKSQDSVSKNLFFDETTNNSIAAYVVGSSDLKKELLQSGIPATHVGAYIIFWNNLAHEREKHLEIFRSRPPENLTNVKFAAGIELKGYNIEHGDFPSGVTTYWKMDSSESIFNIEYGVKHSGKSQEYFILGSHNINHNKNMGKLTDFDSIIDWQKLQLPPKFIPGKYTLAVRVSKIINNSKDNIENIGFSEWSSLADIYIINNKRQVFNRLAKGKLDDYILAVKVIASIF